jgi:xylitol oxidase
MNQMNQQSNWAGNYTYQAQYWHFPGTVEQLQEIVRNMEKVKAVGSRHSFNNIADSQLSIVTLERLEPIMTLNQEEMSVTISANVKYGELGRFLHQHGYALHNLASLPHISVAGACATATHGSGIKNGNLATAVSAIEFVTSDGSLETLSRKENKDTFNGAVVSLGALAILTKLTLDIQPTFDIRQYVYENLPLHQLEAHFDDIMSAGYSVSLFTDWQGSTIDQVWLKGKAIEGTWAKPARTFYEATLAMEDLHPIRAISAENCTPQLGQPGPWHERLPHFRLEFTPSAGDELQSEYFIPRQQAYPAILALNALSHQIAPLLQISEIRTIAADNLWLSPSYQQDSVAFHFTWKPDWPNVQKLLPTIEAALEPFQPRPHWAKLFTLSPSKLQSRCPRLPDFQHLLNQYDPTAKFRNQFLDNYFDNVKLGS